MKPYLDTCPDPRPIQQAWGKRPDSLYMRCSATKLPKSCQGWLRAFPALLVAAAALAIAAPAGAAEPVAGVQTHLLWFDVSDAEVDRQLDEVQALGGGMVRVDVGWSSLQENGPDGWSDWYLEKLDRVVDEAEERGIQLLLTFTWTPCWASSAPPAIKQGCEGEWWNRRVQYYPPENAEDFGNAAAAMAARYRGRVAAWEIWNEPNHPGYFTTTGNRVAEYVQMVQASYEKIKAADPDTTVLAGSLAWSDFNFTKRLYEAGIKGYFDAFSIHPYSGDRSPLNKLRHHSRRSRKTSFVRGIPAVRKRMLQHGDNKPLWLTEFGWNTSNVRDGAPWENGVTERRQAKYLRLAFKRIARWNYVPVAIWFGLENIGTNPMEGLDNYGLVEADGDRKLAFDAFQNTSARLAG